MTNMNFEDFQDSQQRLDWHLRNSSQENINTGACNYFVMYFRISNVINN